MREKSQLPSLFPVGFVELAIQDPPRFGCLLSCFSVIKHGNGLWFPFCKGIPRTRTIFHSKLLVCWFFLNIFFYLPQAYDSNDDVNALYRTPPETAIRWGEIALGFLWRGRSVGLLGNAIATVFVAIWSLGVEKTWENSTDSEFEKLVIFGDGLLENPACFDDIPS